MQTGIDSFWISLSIVNIDNNELTDWEGFQSRHISKEDKGNPL